MERKKDGSLQFLKWFALFAVVLALALPATTKVCKASGDTYRVSVETGYLALRSAKAYDSSNEIGELYTGDTVTVSDYSDSTYWYVYSPKYDKYGYVNRTKLVAMDNNTYSGSTGGNVWNVSVSKGYLALRNGKAYDSSNEIGQLYTGDTVEVYDSSDATYWYVYSPKLGKYGYVNKEYLTGGGAKSSGDMRTVSVSKGYLALRTEKKYDNANEIGQLYSGDVVQVIDSSDTTYWQVYSPKLDKYGFVNKDYLVGASTGGSGDTRTVSVTTGYLALRSSKSFDDSNEIGQLYTGDTVQIIDTNDSTYWYVYSPKIGKNGYVNKDYLTGGSANMTKTVSVSKGYLALRSAKSFDDSNEIGQLYSGDTVEVLDSSDSTYWQVYSPKIGKSGYVNKDYLY